MKWRVEAPSYPLKRDEYEREFIRVTWIGAKQQKMNRNAKVTADP